MIKKGVLWKMNKKNIKKIVIGTSSILTLLAALFVGNIVYASNVQHSQLEMEKAVKAKDLEVGQEVKNSAIKTFDIDNKNYKTFFIDDLSDTENSTTEINTENSTTNDSLTTSTLQSDAKNKVKAVHFMLAEEHIYKIGDKMPVFFLRENEDEVLVAIKHKDGTMSLIKYDVSNISKQYPIKNDRLDKKEVK